MAPVPAGEFEMGCRLPEHAPGEQPAHRVHVGAFRMDIGPVSWALWDEVRAWAERRHYTFDTGSKGKHHAAPDRPAHGVDWYDAVKWCNARSEKEGLPPAYMLSEDDARVYRAGRVDLRNEWVRWDAGYRLPTEAEWEKAARGGASGRRFPWADSDDIDHDRANYYSHGEDGAPSCPYDKAAALGAHPGFRTDDRPGPNPVGAFPANGYGLFDMAGNVWNWCWDWWSEGYYATAPARDPRGPERGSTRVIRGGSWHGRAEDCRVAARNFGLPGDAFEPFGFRAVLAG